MSYLINNAWGEDNVEKATVAFVIGNAAAGKGDAENLLTNEAINLAVKTKADGLHAAGYAPVKELMDGFREKGGIIWVCKACADAKGVKQDDLIAGAELGGAGHTMAFLDAGGQILL